MSHKKTWACIKPDGDRCDGDHQTDLRKHCENLLEELYPYSSEDEYYESRVEEVEAFALQIVNDTLNEFLEEVIELEYQFSNEPNDEDKPGYSLGKFAGANIIKNRLVKLLEDK